MRWIMLAFSLFIVASSLGGFVLAREIVKLGGPAFDWEYIPPAFLLLSGLGSVSFWLWRLSTSK
jgi:hypothetical protein